MRLPQKKQTLPRKIALAAGVVALLCVFYGLYAYATSSWPFATSTESTTEDPTTSQPKVNTSSSQEDLDEKKSFNKAGPNTNADGTGVFDQEGADVDTSAEGLSSSSGNITLYSPKAGQTLSSDLSVKGAAEVASVHYRIKDNINGVIGQGELSVVNGAFSGNLRINTSATSGSFEVYSLDQQGREINHVEVDVRY